MFCTENDPFSLIFFFLALTSFMQNCSTPREAELNDTNTDGHVFSYNFRGQLVYNDYTYSVHGRSGNTCRVYWRCTSYSKTRCSAVITTKGKQYMCFKGFHNHQPKHNKCFIPEVYAKL